MALFARHKRLRQSMLHNIKQSFLSLDESYADTKLLTQLAILPQYQPVYEEQECLAVLFKDFETVDREQIAAGSWVSSEASRDVQRVLDRLGLDRLVALEGVVQCFNDVMLPARCLVWMAELPADLDFDNEEVVQPRLVDGCWKRNRLRLVPSGLHYDFALATMSSVKGYEP